MTKKSEKKVIDNLIDSEYKLGFTTNIESENAPIGLNEDIIRYISNKKSEPSWLLDFRLKSYKKFLSLEEPKWANVNYPKINFNDIIYYASPKVKKTTADGQIDPELLELYEKLGVPLKERNFLSGIAVDAVLDSVSVATTFKDKLKELGIIFCSIDEAVREHPELVRQYLGSVVPYSDNYYATLNSAVFTSGSFCYIPKNVKCPMDLSTYFRINEAKTGQFERTLIIAEEGSYVSYLEGCFTPDNIIFCESGTKIISKINLKDRVYDSYGELRNIKNIMVRQHKGKIYKIKTITDDVIICTPNHPFLVVRKENIKNKKNVETFVEAQNISESDFLCIHQNVYNKFDLREKIGKSFPFIIQNEHKHLLIPIVSIEPLDYAGLVYNLEIETTHTYNVLGYINHNCSAPARPDSQLHAAIVELIAKKNATIKYATVQNWYPGSKDGVGGVYNFVTKRGICEGDNSKISWTQVETGSRITWKYPSVILKGDNSIGEFYSIALTNHYQEADTGTKMIHLGKNTTSTILSKSISAKFSNTTYRGLVKINPGADNAKNFTKCDSLMFGDSKSSTFPYIENKNYLSEIEHEATTSRISHEKLKYLMMRGLSEEASKNLILNGFCKDVFKKLPTEFAIEAQKLLEINLEGSTG